MNILSIEWIKILWVEGEFRMNIFVSGYSLKSNEFHQSQRDFQQDSQVECDSEMENSCHALDLISTKGIIRMAHRSLMITEKNHNRIELSCTEVTHQIEIIFFRTFIRSEISCYGHCVTSEEEKRSCF